MTEFSPIWYTIEEMKHAKPLCMYHKEQDALEEKNNEMKNLHVMAKAHFFAEESETYELRISADDYYKLYINGTFVAMGPAPAYEKHYYYNALDVTPFLKAGENEFVVHLYYQGLINRVWNSGDNRFGIGTELYKCEKNVRDTCLSKKSKIGELQWCYRITDAYSGEIIGYDTQFLENFDTRKWNQLWKEENGGLWKPMVATGNHDYSFFRQPTKQLALYKIFPKEQKRIILEETKDFRTKIWFDLGQEVTGYLRLLAKGKSGQKVRIYLGEECNENGSVRYEMRCNCTYSEEWVLDEGVSKLVPYDYKAFRYGELLLEEGVTIEEIAVEVRHYPMSDEVGTFCCSHKGLEDIFNLCRNGVKYGTQEAYLDCPTREKGQYLGDSVVTAHSQVWLTGSTEMLRKCVDQFAQSTEVCPGLMAVAPGALMQEIADFSLLWSRLLLIDYKFTKDKEFLKRYYPIAKAILEHFAKYEREDGLLEQVADKWNLVDWPENLRDNYDFTLSRPVVAKGCHNVINALYLGALKTLNEIEALLELPKTGRYSEKLEAFYRAFLDKETGLFVDSEGSSHSAVHSNIYPLYFEMQPKDSTTKIVDFLKEKGLCCGVFMSYFFLKGIAKTGAYQTVFDLLVNESEHGWINMLREGATTCFEAWGKDQKWNTSLCHPWGSAPIPIIIEDLLGVSILCNEDGEATYTWNPKMPETVKDYELCLAGKSQVVRLKKETSANSASIN